MHNFNWLMKGEWKRWHKGILHVEYSVFPKGERTERKAFEEFIDHWNPFMMIVLEKNDPKNIIGYLMGADLELSGDDLKKEDKHFGKGDTLYVFSIAVLPKWRGKGIGSCMMREMIQRAGFVPSMIGNRYKRISFHTHSLAFEKLAKKFGFRTVKTGLFEGHKNKYMVKRL